MLWVPDGDMSLREMSCPKATKKVPMRISESGLWTVGWLWKVAGFVELSNPLTREPQPAEQDTLRSLKAFFWALLRELTAKGMHAPANLPWKAFRDEGSLALTDAGARSHVFAQFRHIVKRVRGEDTEKRLVTWSPFDVWRADKGDHGDAPFAWDAYRRGPEGSSGGGGDSGDSPGVTAMAPCNVLFDIATIPHREHTLTWPEEFDRDNWDGAPAEQMEEGEPRGRDGRRAAGLVRWGGGEGGARRNRERRG